MKPPRPRGRFPASARVKKRSEFRSVSANCRRVTTPRFVFLLHARADAGSLPPRLGITASRRVGNAPTRNRAKRVVREAFRALRALFGTGIDVVIIVRHFRAGSGLEDVLEEWSRAQDSLARQCQRAIEAQRAVEAQRAIESGGKDDTEGPARPKGHGQGVSA